MKIFISIAVLIFWISTMGQKIDGVLTVNQAVEMTLDKNFQIRIAKNQADIAQNNNTLGNAGFLPILDLNGSYEKSIQNTEQEFVDGRTQSVDAAERRVYAAGANLVWTLFDGTRMFVAKERLENQSIQSYYTYKAQVDNALAQLLSLYYQVSLEQERLELFQSNIEFSEERLRIVQQKYNVGKESKLALLQAKVDLNTDQSSYIQQREFLQDRKIQLLRVIGVDQEPDFELEAKVTIDSTLLIGELLDLANKQNPNLLAQQINKEIAEQQKQEISRGRLPELNLNMGLNYSNLESEAGFLFANQTAGLTYGFSARMNLFDGFNRQREMQNAQIEQINANVRLDDAVSLVNSSIRTTYNTYINNFNLSKLEAQNLEVALENSEIALERFKLGVSDALELREAQINAINAQIRYLQSLYATKQAEIELQRLTGMISDLKED